MKGGQGVISSLFLSFPAACVEWCSWLHLLVTGVHGVGRDRQPSRAGGFPEGVFVAQREPAAAALPRGGCHQRPGRLAPLQVLGTSDPAAPVFGVFQLWGSLAAVLFLFSSWPFSILDVVQPVALQVQRPLITVVSLVVLGKEEFWKLCEVSVVSLTLLLL